MCLQRAAAGLPTALCRNHSGSAGMMSGRLNPGTVGQETGELPRPEASSALSGCPGWHRAEQIGLAYSRKSQTSQQPTLQRPIQGCAVEGEGQGPLPHSSRVKLSALSAKQSPLSGKVSKQRAPPAGSRSSCGSSPGLSRLPHVYKLSLHEDAAQHGAAHDSSGVPNQQP